MKLLDIIKQYQANPDIVVYLQNNKVMSINKDETITVIGDSGVQILSLIDISINDIEVKPNLKSLNEMRLFATISRWNYFIEHSSYIVLNNFGVIETPFEFRDNQLFIDNVLLVDGSVNIFNFLAQLRLFQLGQQITDLLQDDINESIVFLEWFYKTFVKMITPREGVAELLNNEFGAEIPQKYTVMI